MAESIPVRSISVKRRENNKSSAQSVHIQEGER